MEKHMKVNLAIAPIGWTNDDLPELGGEVTFEQCISEMALAGYSGCEVGNKFPRDVVELKKALSLRGLSIASAWFSAFLTTNPFEETIKAFKKHRDFLHDMGAKVIVVSEQGKSIQGKIDTPLFENKPVFNEEEWNLLKDGLQRLGDLAAEKEMKIVYHHHMGTGIQTTSEIDRLMEETKEEKVSLLYDTGHLVLSGEDHLSILERYHHRIHHVHVKDVRYDIAQRARQEKWSFLKAVRNGVFTVPGDGMIDFTPVFNTLSRNNYEGWIVVEAEQDPAVANPLEYAIKARKYIRSKSGL